MSRLSILVSVAMLSFAGQAFGQEVRSYHVQTFNGPDIIIDSVPAGGFVITDIVATAGGFGNIMLRQDDSGTDTVLGIFRFDALLGVNSFHLESGIPVAPGTILLVDVPQDNDSFVTISGYIPAGSGSVPAVSTWGLVVMALFMLSAGTLVMTRRKPVVA